MDLTRQFFIFFGVCRHTAGLLTVRWHNKPKTKKLARQVHQERTLGFWFLVCYAATQLAIGGLQVFGFWFVMLPHS